METMETYEWYIEQEDRYYKQLSTLELCQCAVFDHIVRYGGQFDEATAKEVLLRIHQLEDTVRLELLRTRLAKAFQAYGMNNVT